MEAKKSHSTCFFKVRCNDCGNEQLVYSHASSVIKCFVCSKTLAVPRGGKVDIKTAIIGVVR